eukprot:COSAG01_NODE_2120_length_8375_cov_364.611890_6_plen_193_part_00
MSLICSLHTTALRTIVVRQRRKHGITKKLSKPQLLAFIRVHSKLQSVPDLNSMTKAELAAIKAELVDKYHPVPSRMNRDELLSYVYFTANKLQWHWPTSNPGLSNRVTRKCLGSRAPGSHPYPPKAILSRANRGPPRTPSAYNLHVKEMMTENREAIPEPQERFADAVRSWNQKKTLLQKENGTAQETQEAG